MNEDFEKWWKERKGVGYVGFGKSRDGVYLTEFVRDAYAAWCYAYELGEANNEVQLWAFAGREATDQI